MCLVTALVTPGPHNTPSSRAQGLSVPLCVHGRAAVQGLHLLP